MPIGHDAVGTNYKGLVTATSTPSFSITTIADNATIYIVEFYVTGGVTPGPTTNSYTVTRSGGSPVAASLAGYYQSSLGMLAVYKCVAGLAGAYTVNATIGTNEWYIASCFSKTGVAAEGNFQLGSVNSSPLSKTPSFTSGDEIVSLCGVWNNGGTQTAVPTVSGGNNRINIFESTSKHTSLVVSDSDTLSTTFGVTPDHANANSLYYLAFELFPPVVPSGATIITTSGAATVTAPQELDPATGVENFVPGTPGVFIIDPGVFPISGQVVDFYPGTPVVTAPTVLTPGAATLATLASSPSVLSNSFAPVLAKMAANQDVTIVIIGDSITWGYGDTVTTPWTHGWTGLFGVIFGQLYDLNVDIKVWDDQHGIGGPSGQFYDAVYSLYSSPNGGRSTIHIVNGGACSMEINYMNDNTRLPILLGDAPNIDYLILASLINDYDADNDTTTQYVTNYEAWLTHIQTILPFTPILATNENKTNYAVGETHFTAYSAALFSAIAGWPNVALMDTRSFYTDLVNMVQPSGTSLGVHPVRAGYNAQAIGMAQILDPSWILPAGTSIVTTRGVPTISAPRTVALGQASMSTIAGVPLVDSTHIIMAGADAITTSSGQPGVTAPIVLSPVGGEIVTQNAQPVVSAPQVVRPAGASIVSTAGTPGAFKGNIVSPGGASAAITPGLPGVSAPNVISPGGKTIVTTADPATVTRIDYSDVTSIWFMGVKNERVGKRIITRKQWEAIIPTGGPYYDTVWSEENGYSVPGNILNTLQKEVLDNDSEFQLNRSGPRV